MTKIIDLYGGPGTGKSTSAAYLYWALKAANKNAELVREYVKNWAWEGRKISKYDQMYFLGKQARAESLLYGKVDYIVTDSPVMLSAYYADHYQSEMSHGVIEAVKGFYGQAVQDGHQHVHVFLTRTKPYITAGRWQNEEEAKQIDAGIKATLADHGISYVEVGTEEAELKRLLTLVEAA